MSDAVALAAQIYELWRLANHPDGEIKVLIKKGLQEGEAVAAAIAELASRDFINYSIETLARKHINDYYDVIIVFFPH